jgi:glycosyltransferase involved in cell wall biosynthesis
VSAARTVLIANPGADLYGSDRMVLETVDALQSVSWRVVVSLPGPGPLVDELSARGAEIVYCRTPVVRKSAMRPLGALRLLVDLILGVMPALALIRRVRPDAVYVNTITAPLWLLLPRILRRYTVCHIHEGEASASRAVLRLLNLPLLLADDLIINSEFSRAVLADVFPKLAARTSVVYNSVRGPQSVQSPRPDLLAPIRLLYVGRLSPRKGVDIAIDALAELKARGVEANLGLVGAVFPGYEWFRVDLEEKVRARQLGELVTFQGFQRDTWPFAAAADILLVPSAVDEPFGNTAVEAALAARPCVVSDLAGLKEATYGLGGVIRVPAGSALAIADAIEQIVRDWQGFRDRALEDREFATARYSANAYTKQILDVLDARGN